MNDRMLRQELDRVGRRYAAWWRAIGLAAFWGVLSLVGCVAIVAGVRQGHSVPLWMIAALVVMAVIVLPVLSWLLRRTRDPVWVAHRVEQRFPDLSARLLAALEQKPGPDTGRLGYLQDTVVGETLAHARAKRWDNFVSPWAFRLGTWAQRGALACFLIVLLAMLVAGPHWARRGEPNAAAGTGETITVQPGDTSIERGTGMLVLARFGGPLPGEVRLLSRNADGQVETAAMSKSLDDPVFAARVPSVSRDLEYAVRYGDQETKWFKATVFDYPELQRADADLKSPAFTHLPDKQLQDVRSITAVEGSSARLSLRLNKPVTQAQLVPAAPAKDSPAGAPLKLVPDPADPTLYTASIDLKQSQTLRLQLVDADGRQNKQPAAELAIKVNPNRPPELKPVTPGRDVDVSPIQELSTGVRVWDDLGVRRTGLTYSVAGQPEQEVVLASDVPGGEKRDVSQMISLEQAKAQADQLVSYYFWAEDFGPDGNVRRTAGDMYFAEVRPFDEIFRQGEQPSASQQQQQQQQGQGNSEQAEKLAELQKQIIAATWKVIRRETSAAPSAAFAPDAKLLAESQTSAREQAAALAEDLNDAKSRAYLKNVLGHMDRAVKALEDATATPALTPALAAEQAAYQELLRLRAREFDVVQGQQSQSQSASASSASSRRQQQLDQLQLDQEQNRYETQRSAAPQQENPQQRETRQVLSRLKELAQRQEDLNRQMQELKSALEQVRDPQQKEELQRQLARLRDQQQQQLRDTDELRDRMDQPQNQQEMAEARQQLEQTRENVRRSAESLEQARVPEAATSGARASEQLNNLRDEVRRRASNQLAESMTDLRQQARTLDENQQRLGEKLNSLDAAANRSLRDSGDRQQLAKDLGQQKQQLDQLLDTMRKTVDASEASEPLVSKQLYDTLRQTDQRKPDQALDVSRELLDRGFTGEARQAGGEAAKGIAQLRQGVEQAATSVLGDEAESLRRARNELDRLAQELQREVDRNRPAGQSASAGPATRPANGAAIASGPTTRRSGQQANARREPTTRDAQQADGPRGPTTRGSSQLAIGGTGEPTRDGQSTQQGNSREQAGQQGEWPNQIDNPSGQSRTAGQGPRQSEQSGQEQSAGGQPPLEGQPGSAQEPGQADEARSDSQPGENEQGGRRRSNSSADQRRAGTGPGERQPRQAQSGERRPDGQPSGPQGQPGQQQREQGQAGQQGQQGQPGGQGQQGEGQPDQQGQIQRGRQGGQRGTAANGGEQDGRAGDAPRGEAGNESAGGGDAGDPNRRGSGFTGPGTDDARGPLTGDNFRDWSDRLRDVEDMVSDPRLRDRAARIRERARDLRAELKRHSQQPNWNVVDQTLGQPLAELRDAVAQELLRRDKPDALVPLDREAVPPQYAEQVRRYYERLGSGR